MLPSTEFTWPIKVYYEDTDAGGVVYYANYLKFFERARSEWLNAMGLDQAKMLEDDIAFAVKKAEVEYIKPARLNDDCVVVSRIIEVKGASMIFEQALYAKQEQVLEQVPEQQTALCQAVIKVACLKLKSFTPCRLPANVKKEIQRVC
jgi:acyl-CoA thioester hydrolase